MKSHPARGRRIRRFLLYIVQLAQQCHHTPQGDGDQSFFILQKNTSFCTVITSRKGTVEIPVSWKPPGSCSSITPQGDVGSSSLSVIRLKHSSTKSHPARGRRKTRGLRVLANDFILVTPRKGTQTTAPLYCTVLCGEARRLFFCEILGCS